MGKAKRNRGKQNQAGTPARAPNSVPRLKATIIAAVMGFVAGAALAAGVFAIRSGRHPLITASRFDPTTFGTLLTMSPDQLQGMDIAIVNLLCAQGLPGAEEMDISKTPATLDRWAARVKSETERYRPRLNDPKYAEHYGHSEAKYRAEMLVQVLQEDFGVHYHEGFNPNSDAPPVFKSSKDCFLHGLVNDPNGGNCVSMPVVYVAVARRLGYPVKLVTSREHTFCRWEGLDSPNAAWRERFNFDAPGKGFSIDLDDFYLTWPKVSTLEQVEANQWLKSLSVPQELALFLLMRGHVLRDNDRMREAQVAYAVANQLWPENQSTASWLAKVVDTRFHLTGVSNGTQSNLIGWRKSPAAIEASRLDVERINAENRRLMDAQQQRQTIARPYFSLPKPR